MVISYPFPSVSLSPKKEKNMAKQRFGINDGYRGSVGTVIGYMWRGKWCMRARPRFVRNPRTQKQQSNRLLFRQMVALAGCMKLALRKGLHVLSMAQHITECNYFVKYNKACFSLDSEGRMAVDWEGLIVSDGALAAPLFSTPLPPSQGRDGGREGGQGGAIVIPFATYAPDERGSGDDEVYLYAYRRSQQVSITLPETWQGKEVHLYGFAVDHKGTASPTTYIGVLEAEPIETQRAVSQENNNSPSSSIMPLPLGKTHHKNSVSSRPSSLTFSPDSESQKNQYRPGLRWSCP